MALIGVLARVDAESRQDVLTSLTGVVGVSIFPLGEDERIGFLLERPSLDDTHAALKDEIENLPGVLGTWPVFSYNGDEDVPHELVTRHSQSMEADVDG